MPRVIGVCRRGHHLAVIAAAATLALFCSVGVKGQQPISVQDDVVRGEVLVQFKPGIGNGRRANVRARHGASVLRSLDGLRAERLRLPANADPIAVARALAAEADVEAAQPNFVRRSTAPSPPNDPYWLNGSLWGLERISASPAWTNFGDGANTVVVADIDTGVDYTHPDLAAHMWTNPGEIPGNGVDDDNDGYIDDVYGINAITGSGNPADDHGHGSHTSGTFGAVANNSVGIAGVARNVRILACKFISSQGSGYDSDAAECLNYVVMLKQRGVNIRVTNNSWGSARGAQIATVLKNAVDAAGNAGIVNVFAAGNNGTNNDTTPFDPASFTSPSIISVAASDTGDGRASFSNYGAVSVDLAAPGVGIWSTLPGSYAAWNGTSMATPHVAGAVALLLSHRPSLTVSEAKNLVLANVDTLSQWSGLVASGGRLNLVRMLSGSGTNAIPTVNISSPADNSSFTAPAQIVIGANASDSDGTVSQVSFYADGGLIGTDATAPYSVTWSGVAVGSYSLTAVATDNAGATTTSAAVAVTVTTPSSGGGSTAAFVGIDTTTKGSWKGTYGTQGSALVGDVTTLPPGASVVPTGAGAWTWAATTSDIRALQKANSPTDRLAATWYTSGVPFTLDLTTGDTATHRVTLYAVDWDTTARTERIDVLDPTTGAVLDSRTLTGFNGGQYITWRVTGPVRLRVTVAAGFNAVVSGLFIDSDATGNQRPSVDLTTPVPGASFEAPATIGLMAGATDSDGTVAQVAFYANGGLIATDATAPYSVTWSGVSAGSYSLTAVATDNAGATTTSAAVAVTVTTPSSGGGSTAAFVGIDTTTKGSWKGTYGIQGSALVGDVTTLPPGASVVPTGAGAWTWAATTSDVRALQKASSLTDRLAATWYTSGAPFTLDVTTGDTAAHRVTLYAVDWDTTGRSERIDVLDPSTGTVLDSRTVTDFSGGQYITWRVTGPVRLRVTVAAGFNAVVSGLFIDPENQPPSVSLTTPVPGASFEASATIGLMAGASDSDGAVAQVTFYANGGPIATDTTAPYSVTWSDVSAGTYTLTAVATDDAGDMTTSSSVRVIVTAPVGSNGDSDSLNNRVLVVYNSAVSDSLAVADYYMQKRDIPAENKCAIHKTGNLEFFDSLEEYNAIERDPIRACLAAVGPQKILYIVFSYGTPFRTIGISTDQLVTDIWDLQPTDIEGFTTNPYYAISASGDNSYPPGMSFAEFRGSNALIYSVWRLDAPTPALARGLVDQALQVEASGGLNGRGCFDGRSGDVTGYPDGGSGSGDWDIFRASQMFANAGFEVVLDTDLAEFGTPPAPLRCEGAAFYTGWYSFGHYNDAFSWNPGAIGWHLDSASATSPRTSDNWAGGALGRGIAVTTGAVTEPYLEGLPHADGALRNLFEGLNVGDAIFRNTEFIRWRIINIGDPLYQPFSGGRPLSQ